MTSRTQLAPVRVAFAALCLLFAAGCAQLPPSGGTDSVAAFPYDYPFDNPWTATVLGTPEALRVELQEDAGFDYRTLTVFESREVPEGF